MCENLDILLNLIIEISYAIRVPTYTSETETHLRMKGDVTYYVFRCLYYLS